MRVTRLFLMLAWALMLLSLSKWMLAESRAADAWPRLTSLNLCLDQYLVAQIPNAQSLQTVEAHQGRIERILRFAPELVVATEFSSPLLVHYLKNHGLDVQILAEPSSIAAVSALQQQLQHLLSLDGMTVSALDRLFDLQPLQGKRLLWFQENNLSFGADTLFTEVIDQLGGENVAAQQGSGLVRFNLEDLWLLRPDIVIMEASIMADTAADVIENTDFALAQTGAYHRAFQQYIEQPQVRVLILPRTMMGCFSYQLPEFVHHISAILGGEGND
ncbi:MAG: hypothetical protein LAT77_06015 [Aliidiomarina sp.]|uniref:hypothetical protein n=1 Tax=Aliidiomarina sp. TaxID=1872439 RepID=UPI0025C6BBB1|nr:hypothetical protein [Aliidiomarina sp.]MCH8501450.1 hypothetical protein [Aliidiomarina sp.]